MIIVKHNIWKWVTVLLSAVALVLCVLMLRQSLTTDSLIGCSAGSSCDNVLSSSWSKVFSFFPVAGLALVLYIAIIVCILFIDNQELKPIVRKILLVCAGCIIGSALWFSIIQIFILHTFCPYCLSVHGLGVIVSVLILSKFKGIRLILLGFVFAILLAIVQILTPKTNYSKGDFINELSSFYQNELPIIGDASNSEIITLLFDYQCSHCQKIHRVIPSLIEKFEGKVSFALCPSPLSFKCNPYIPISDKDNFNGSCDLARLSISLYYALGLEAFLEFDKWLFEADSAKGWYPRSIDEARLKAEQIAGSKEALEVMITDPKIEIFFSKSFELFSRSTVGTQAAVPRFIYNNSWLVPQINDGEALVELLKDNFDLSF